MALKFYFDLLSQPVRATYIFLKMNNIKFTPKVVNLGKGEHFTDEFAEVNPFKRVPVIDDDGFKLTESVAILQYLAEKHNVPDHWWPKDLNKRAKVNEYMNWQHYNLRWNGSMVFQHKALIPRLTGRPIDEKKLNSHLKKLDDNLDSLENIFLRDQPFVAGNEISIADLLCICELMQPQMAGYNYGETRPKLLKYMSLVQGQLEPHFDEAHKVLYKMRDMATKKFGVSKL
uniref:glutathione S-transferase theta-1-like n=1 Tax=Lineus longissimus TaxID=88925 RepID=UPI002B4E57E5